MFTEKVFSDEKREIQKYIDEFKRHLYIAFEVCHVSILADVETKYIIDKKYTEDEGYEIDFTVSYREKNYYNNELNLGFATEIFAKKVLAYLSNIMEEEGFKKEEGDEEGTKYTFCIV